MNRFRKILLHICVVCSFIGTIVMVLDWYNPFMNFSGHIVYIQMLLYLSVFIMELSAQKEQKKK